MGDSSKELLPSKKSSPETGYEENKSKLSSSSGSSIPEEIIEIDSDKSSSSIPEEILSDESSEETGSDKSQKKSGEGKALIKSNMDTASSDCLRTNQNVSDISLISEEGFAPVKLYDAASHANQNVSDISLISEEGLAPVKLYDAASHANQNVSDISLISEEGLAPVKLYDAASHANQNVSDISLISEEGLAPVKLYDAASHANQNVSDISLISEEGLAPVKLYDAASHANQNVSDISLISEEGLAPVKLYDAASHANQNISDILLISEEGMAPVKLYDAASHANQSVSDISLISEESMAPVKLYDAASHANQNVSDISLICGKNKASKTPSLATTSSSSLGILPHLINLDNEILGDEIDCYNKKNVFKVDKSIDALGSSINPGSLKTLNDESVDSSVLKGELIEPGEANLNETLISSTQESEKHELGASEEFLSNEATAKQMTTTFKIEDLPSFKNAFPTYWAKLKDEENERGMIKTPIEEKNVSGKVIQLTEEGDLAKGNILDLNVPMQKEKEMHISAFEDEFKILNISKSEDYKVTTSDTTFVKEEETVEKVAEAKTKLYQKESCENVKDSKSLSKTESKNYSFIDVNAQWLNEKYDKKGHRIEKKTGNKMERFIDTKKANEIEQEKKQPGQHFAGHFESWVITPSNDEVHEGRARRAGFTFNLSGKPVPIAPKKSKIPCAISFWENKYVRSSSKTRMESSASDPKASKKNDEVKETGKPVQTGAEKPKLPSAISNWEMKYVAPKKKDDHPNMSRVEMARKIYSKGVAIRNKILLQKPVDTRYREVSEMPVIEPPSSPENVKNLINEKKTVEPLKAPKALKKPPKTAWEQLALKTSAGPSTLPEPAVASDPERASSATKRKSFIPVRKGAALPKAAKNPIEGIWSSRAMSDEAKKALAERRALARTYTRKLRAPGTRRSHLPAVSRYYRSIAETIPDPLLRSVHHAAVSRHSSLIEGSAAGIDSGIPQSQNIVEALLAPKQTKKPKDTCPFVYKGN